jgi:TetR/AcrR family transcriptional regulator, mexJK operon transcriptional repressor
VSASTTKSSRTARQRDSIVEAAADVFAREGFPGARTDEIAALAAVSKQTLYKHFPSKEQLFTEVVLSTSGLAAGLAVSLLDSHPSTAEETRAVLAVLARRFIQTIIRPEVIQMRRLVIAETERFPGMGRTYYAEGPERFTTTIAPWLKDRMDAGLLRPADPQLAAHHFTWLVISVPWNKALFCASDATFTAAELNHFADAGVEAFLAGYLIPGPAHGGAAG